MNRKMTLYEVVKTALDEIAEKRGALLLLGQYILPIALLYFTTVCITTALVTFSILPELGFPILAAVLVSAGLCDFLLTRHALHLGCREANPVVRWLLRRLGWRTVFVLMAVLVFAAWYASTKLFSFAVVIFYLGVLANNAVAIHRKARAHR